jgi:hypothetical protein
LNELNVELAERDDGDVSLVGFHPEGRRSDTGPDAVDWGDGEFGSGG